MDYEESCGCGFESCVCTVTYHEFLELKRSHDALLRASQSIIDYVDAFDAEGSRRLSDLISAIEVASSK